MKIQIKFVVFVCLTLFFGFIFTESVSATVSFDQSFGVNGKTITSFGKDAFLFRIVLQSDGKIIASGNASNGTNQDWKIARYGSDGVLDAAFGNNGVVTKDFGSGNDSLEVVTLQSDGKIVVGGHSTNSNGNRVWTLARYNADGNPDVSFGDDRSSS